MDPNPSSVWLTLLVVALFLIVFPLFWCFVCTLLSWVGGWSRLAKLYPAPLQAPSQSNTFVSLSGRSGRVGGVNYKGVLSIRTDAAGMHLSVMVLFRCGHPPLLIPWSALRNRQLVSFWFLGSVMKCDAGSPTVTTLILPKEAFDKAPDA